MTDKINNQRLNQHIKRGNIYFNYCNVDNNKKTINESRLNYSLNLRKNKLFKTIMQKRNIQNYKKEKYLNLCINIDLLNLNIYKNEINKFKHLIIDDDKYKFLINAIVNNIHIEIFQTDFLFFKNCNNEFHETSDFIKFCLKNLYEILNTFGNSLNIINSKQFFNSILYELFMTNELNVKFTIIKILELYTNLSKEFNSFFINDMRYIKNLYKLTFIDNNDIIIVIFTIIYNIICDYPNEFEKIISISPFHTRLNEFIILNKKYIQSNENYLIELVEFLEKFIVLININLYSIYQKLILFFYETIIQNNNENYKLNLTIYEILSKISIDDNISKIIISCGFGDLIHEQMKQNNLQNKDYLFFQLQTMINLLSIEYIATYFIKKNILDTLSLILNKYNNNNENKEKDNIVYLCIYCLSNIGASSINLIHSLIKSKILNKLLKIIDYRKSNNIYFETCTLFLNIICNCSSEDFNYINENLKIMEFFYEGIYKSNKNEYLSICLKGIYCLIMRNEKFTLFSEIVKETLSQLIYHQNNEISNLSELTIKLIETKNKKFI